MCDNCKKYEELAEEIGKQLPDGDFSHVRNEVISVVAHDDGVTLMQKRSISSVTTEGADHKVEHAYIFLPKGFLGDIAEQLMQVYIINTLHETNQKEDNGSD